MKAIKNNLWIILLMINGLCASGEPVLDYHGLSKGGGPVHVDKDLANATYMPPGYCGVEEKEKGVYKLAYYWPSGSAGSYYGELNDKQKWKVKGNLQSAIYLCEKNFTVSETDKSMFQSLLEDEEALRFFPYVIEYIKQDQDVFYLDAPKYGKGINEKELAILSELAVIYVKSLKSSMNS